MKTALTLLDWIDKYIMQHSIKQQADHYTTTNKIILQLLMSISSYTNQPIDQHVSLQIHAILFEPWLWPPQFLELNRTMTAIVCIRFREWCTRIHVREWFWATWMRLIKCLLFCLATRKHEISWKYFLNLFSRYCCCSLQEHIG